jgi:hypothetical protein
MNVLEREQILPSGHELRVFGDPQDNQQDKEKHDRFFVKGNRPKFSVLASNR